MLVSTGKSHLHKPRKIWLESIYQEYSVQKPAEAQLWTLAVTQLPHGGRQWKEMASLMLSPPLSMERDTRSITSAFCFFSSIIVTVMDASETYINQFEHRERNALPQPCSRPVAMLEAALRFIGPLDRALLL